MNAKGKARAADVEAERVGTTRKAKRKGGKGITSKGDDTADNTGGKLPNELGSAVASDPRSDVATPVLPSEDPGLTGGKAAQSSREMGELFQQIP